MELTLLAQRLCDFLAEQPEVKGCRLYGSLSTGTWDQYSDIDIEIDVSGTDNSLFLTHLPERISKAFPLVFFDYAPSLAPEKYVVTLAVDETNPFRMADIACTATPHCPTLNRQALSALNSPQDHLLKLFSANLKHYLRGADCRREIEKMYVKALGPAEPLLSQAQMLRSVHAYLTAKVTSPARQRWLESCVPYLNRLTP